MVVDRFRQRLTGFRTAGLLGFSLALLLVAFASEVPAASEEVTHPLEAFTVLALAPLDERAVVRLPGGELLVVEVDDPLPRTTAVVAKVLADRLVVEEEVAGESRRRQVWIFKPEKLGARSRVVTLDPTPPPLPPVTKPQIITLDSGDPVTPVTEESPRSKTDAQ